MLTSLKIRPCLPKTTPRSICRSSSSNFDRSVFLTARLEKSKVCHCFRSTLAKLLAANESTISGNKSFLSIGFLSLNYLVTAGDLDRGPESGRHGTIFGIGKLDGRSQRLLRNVTSIYDMVNVHLSKRPRVLRAALAGDLDPVVGHVLALL